MIRDRTKLFQQFRKSYERDIYNKEDINSFELHNMNLYPTNTNSNKEYIKLDMDAEYPEWVDLKEEIQEGLVKLEKEVNSLQILHKQRLLPGFTDRSEEEKEILELSQIINSQMRQVHNLIKRINSAEMNFKEPLVIKNVQISLAVKLQELSKAFQTAQKDYVYKLRQREGGDKHDLIHFKGIENDTEDPHSFQLVEEVQEYNYGEEAYIIQRESEIEQIHQTITNIADLFRSLQSMVIEQGSLLDRIDYNVEQMNEHVKEANQELNMTVAYQRSSRSKYCILLLLALIILLLILIGFKKQKA